MNKQSALWWHIFEYTGNIEAYMTLYALEHQEEE